MKITNGFYRLTLISPKERRNRVFVIFIGAGWFHEGQLCTALQDGKECEKPTRAALTTESNTYISLKRAKVIDFDREWVWRP